MPTKVKGTTGVDKIESGAVITNPAFSGDATVSGSLTIAGETAATQNSLGVRNLIINGDMRIAQRGTSSTGQTTAGYKTCDRFYVNINTAGTWTITQDTDVPTGQGFSNSLKLDCTTADASLTGTHQIGIDTRPEAQMLQHLKFGTSSAEKITLSYWIKSNKTGIHTVEFFNQDANRTISKEINIDTADTWEKKTWVVDGDTVGSITNDNGIGFVIKWWLGVGSDFSSGTLDTSWATRTNANRVSSSNVNLADSTSNYINITGVQLEVGEVATEFEHRPYDMELARCQRYYWRWTDEHVILPMAAYSTTAIYGVFVYPTTMRTGPTGNISDAAHLTLFMSGSGSVSSYSFSTSKAESIRVSVTAVAPRTQGHAGWLRLNAGGGKYIELNAEL